MSTAPISRTEWAVLGLLAEQPAHPFALARSLSPGGELGRILTVRRPLVYRALDRLVAAGLAEPLHSEPGDAGPRRTIHQITVFGRNRFADWVATPVDHVRDLRIDFNLKMALLHRAERSPGPLITAQRQTLADTLRALQELPAEPDEIDLWRHHNAAAADAFLTDLARRYS